MSVPTVEAIRSALDQVLDPEIRKPITELDMVEKIDVADSGAVTVRVLLTIPGCPMKNTITRDVTNAVLGVEGVTDAHVDLGSMTEEQRENLRTKVGGSSGKPERPCTTPD